MKTELQPLTPEQEQRIVSQLRALYIGQKVLQSYSYTTPITVSGHWVDCGGTYEWLQLRSIDSLTDDEAIQVFRVTYPMFIGDKVDMPTVRRLNSQIFTNGSYSAKTHCTLIKMGCAVKLLDYESGEWIMPDEQISRGWIKLSN